MAISCFLPMRIIDVTIKATDMKTYRIIDIRSKLSNGILLDERKHDWRYQIMDLTDDMLLNKLKSLKRKELVAWLTWNDPNGIFSDEEAKANDRTPLNKYQAMAYLYLIIMRDQEDWDGKMAGTYIEDLSFLE
ncbi:hypothetical protein L950_0226425 [Sphingobacterium sp. IITKGP-BTPF85]|nr:hypothetical protein L950_0226425 [Sphingobacterium sp. IITKGP-BTPF85]